MTQHVSAQDARTAPDSNPVSWQAQDDVLLITINNPPVNALGHAVVVRVELHLRGREGDLDGP